MARRSWLRNLLFGLGRVLLGFFTFLGGNSGFVRVVMHFRDLNWILGRAVLVPTDTPCADFGEEDDSALALEVLVGAGLVVAKIERYRVLARAIGANGVWLAQDCGSFIEFQLA